VRLSRLLTPLLSLALVAGPAAVVSAPAAAAAETYPSEVHIALDKRKVRFNDTFGIQGQVFVTAADGQKYFVEYAEVKLQRMFLGKAWRTIANTTAGYDGVFRFYSVVGKQNAKYRVTYDGQTVTTETGEATFTGSTSEPRLLRVARDIRVGSAKRNGAMYFNGRVLPNYKNRVVQIQTRKCQKCAWKLFKKVRTNARSRFNVRVAVPRNGTWHYRAKTPKSRAFIASLSKRYLSVYMF
jgi:hypothetical protein